MTTSIKIEVSPGEFIDKLTISDIRRGRVRDPEKRANVEVEHRALRTVYETLLPSLSRISELKAKLQCINEALWDIEEEIRECERRCDFGPKFIELARSVYKTNDRRSAVKSEINSALGSKIVEEKSYKPY